MAEFRFDLRPLFTESIVKVTSNLLPHTFRGDRRQCLDATSKMSEIIDRLGQLSASAQKLNKPVTTAQRLRMAENQTIYLMGDVNTGQNGSVVGLLKVGTKDLYLFDEVGQTRKIDNAPCILDFYIHETRQRTGLGKDLFETMLADEKWTPVKCSVDRPSEKLLGFLKKHYDLVRTIPQANNFVLYEGFFEDGYEQPQQEKRFNGGRHISPNTQLFGATFVGEQNNQRRIQRQPDSSNLVTQITQISPVGRYGARKPTCSMAEKNGSDVSLTPSQAAEQAKLTGLKHPLDALSKPSKLMAMERRSGLQDVDEEYLKQNVFRKSLFSQNSGYNDGNVSQNQMVNQNAAGQPSIPPYEGYVSNNAQINAQQNYQHPPMQAAPQQHQNSAAAQQQLYQQYQQHQQHQQHMQQLQHQHHHQQLQHQAHSSMPQQYHTHPSTPQQYQQPAASPAGKQMQMQSQPQNPPEAMQQQQNQQIIHSGVTPSQCGSEPGGDQTNTAEIVNENLQNLKINEHEQTDGEQQKDETDVDLETPADIDQLVNSADTTTELDGHIKKDSLNIGEQSQPQPIKGTSEFEMENRKTAPTFHLSKQHTGMKNQSYGVGMAVTPSTKMEFDQDSREDFGVVKINRPINKQTLSSNAHDETMSTISSTGEGLTDQGYYDLKFYHNKLW